MSALKTSGDHEARFVRLVRSSRLVGRNIPSPGIPVDGQFRLAGRSSDQRELVQACFGIFFAFKRFSIEGFVTYAKHEKATMWSNIMDCEFNDLPSFVCGLRGSTHHVGLVLPIFKRFTALKRITTKSVFRGLENARPGFALQMPATKATRGTTFPASGILRFLTYFQRLLTSAPALTLRFIMCNIVS